MTDRKAYCAAVLVLFGLFLIGFALGYWARG